MYHELLACPAREDRRGLLSDKFMGRAVGWSLEAKRCNALTPQHFIGSSLSRVFAFILFVLFSNQYYRKPVPMSLLT